MDIGTISILLLIGLLILLAIGMPLGLASASLAVGILVLKFGPDLLFSNFGRGPLNLVSQAIWRQITNFVLISVPLFLFMAALLERSGIAEDMYSSLNVWLSRTRGGIAIVTSIMAVIMAAMSGIIGGEVVLLGLIALPQMLRLGYNRNLAIGTICASGSLGTMIPPSIVLIFLWLDHRDFDQITFHRVFPARLYAGVVLHHLHYYPHPAESGPSSVARARSRRPAGPGKGAIVCCILDAHGHGCHGAAADTRPVP